MKRSLETSRRGRPATTAADVNQRAVVNVRSQKYYTNNNINVSSSQHLPTLPNHHHHQQQQQQQWVEMQQKVEMRRKLAQWCEWRRRYGIMSSICITQELRGPQLPLRQPSASSSKISNQTVNSRPSRNQYLPA